MLRVSVNSAREQADNSARLLESYVLEHISEALANGQINVWYQPVVRVQTRCVCGLEALVRWNSDTYGLLMPNDFVPVLERAGRIGLLDLHVLDEAARAVRELIDKGKLEFLPVSINVSSETFAAMSFPAAYEEAIHRYDLPSWALEVEVRGDVSPVEVTRLRGMGARVWADDFGDMRSPATVLSEAPYDAIKFSKRLMGDYRGDQRKFAIMETMIDLAKRLDCQVSAKYVETEQQFLALNNVGCAKVQGHYFCQAAPIESLPGLLEEKGIGLEPSESRIYFDATSKVNLQASSYREATGTLGVKADPYPVAVLELTENSVRYLAANRTYIDFLSEANVGSIQEAEALLNDTSQDGSRAMRRAAEQARSTGIDQTFGFMQDGRHHRSQVHFLTSDESRGTFAILITTLDLSHFDISSIRATDSGAPGSGTVITKDILWDSLLSMRKLGFFWKDEHRRFVGVSPYFLEYYGFDSAADVVGKTDEDVGWHVRPGKFANDELGVIKDGVCVEEAHGTCIAKGDIREIVANKVPIYLHNKIIGLLGCFRDVTQGEGIALADMGEGGGEVKKGTLRGWFAYYLLAYEHDGADFLLCIIELSNLDKIGKAHGESVARDVSDAYVHQVEHALSNGGVFERPRYDLVLVLKQFTRMGDADVFIETMRSITALVDEVDGIEVDLEVSTAAAWYASCGNVEGLRDMMRQRMRGFKGVKSLDELDSLFSNTRM